MCWNGVWDGESAHRRSRIKQKGFTSLEALVVLALTGILVGMAVLGLPRLVSSLRLLAAAQEVIGTLHTARIWAVQGTRQHRVAFSVGSTQYVLERREDDGSWRSVAGQRKVLPGIHIESANSGADLVFFARGNCENGTVVLADRFGGTRRVVLNQRGRVRLE